MESQSALFDAVGLGNETAVAQILALGGSIHKADAQGLTALHWAAFFDYQCLSAL
jgi:ankyrin repeat protein